MSTLRRILAPVDFSESSRKAVGYGIALAEKTGAKLYLAHVLAPVPEFGYVFPDNPPDTNALRITDARQTLLDLLPANRDQLRYELIAKIGAVEHELLGMVRDESIDLVIMGTRGRTRLRRWFLGSVTEHLLRKVPVPVLTVSHITPEHEATAGKLPGIERILFATDLGLGVEKGATASAELAKYFNATLTVAHVVPTSSFGDQLAPFPGEFLYSEDAATIADRMDGLTRSYMTDLKICTAILHGEPFEAILRFADENSIDLIVLNLERKPALERVLLGTTAEQVVRLAHMPVLSIPVEVRVAAVDMSVA
jgi:nucleotide-binding universal stress UspA family protein